MRDYMGVGGYRNTWAELWLCQMETVGGNPNKDRMSSQEGHWKGEDVKVV